MHECNVTSSILKQWRHVFIFLALDEADSKSEHLADKHEEEETTDTQQFHSGSLCGVCSICEVQAWFQCSKVLQSIWQETTR